MAKVTLKNIDKAINEAVEKNIGKAVGKKVVKVVAKKAESIQGRSIGIKKVRITPEKTAEIKKEKQQEEAYKEMTLPKNLINIDTGVNLKILIQNPKYAMMKYAYYIYRIIAGTPVDEDYTRVETRQTIPTLKKAKSYFKKNKISVPRITKTLITHHEADDSDLRDYWEFNITTKSNSVTLTSKDFSSINFDTNINKRKVEAIVNILMTATNKEPIKNMAVNVSGGEDMVKRFKVLEFGKYPLGISKWNQSGSKGDRKHGVVNGYSVQAPLGILATAQVEQDALSEVLNERLDNIEKPAFEIFDKFFKDYTKVINNIKKTMFVLSIPENENIDIETLPEEEDTKYMSTATYLDSTYKGSLGHAARQAIMSNLDKSATFGAGMRRLFRQTVNADLKFSKSRNITVSARVKKLKEWEDEYSKKEAEKEAERERVRLEKEAEKNERMAERIKIMTEALKKDRVIKSSMLRAYNLGFGDKYQDFDTLMMGLSDIDENIDELTEEIEKIGVEIQDKNKRRIELQGNLRELERHKNYNKNPEWEKTVKAYEKVRKSQKKLQKERDKAYTVCSDYLKMYTSSFLKLENDDRIDILNSISVSDDQSGNEILIDFMGDAINMQLKNSKTIHKIKVPSKSAIKDWKDVVADIKQTEKENKKKKPIKTNKKNKAEVYNEDEINKKINKTPIKNSGNNDPVIFNGIEIPIPKGYKTVRTEGKLIIQPTDVKGANGLQLMYVASKNQWFYMAGNKFVNPSDFLDL